MQEHRHLRSRPEDSTALVQNPLQVPPIMCAMISSTSTHQGTSTSPVS